MRLKMDNHYGTVSVIAEMDNNTDDIEFTIRKTKGYIRKKIYYKIEIGHKLNKIRLTLNEEQLIGLSMNLYKYVESGNYKKRTDSKASKVDSIL